MILLIDDSATQRIGLARLLREAGYHQLIEASSALDALDCLHECGAEIDLILSDLNMPGANGIEVCRMVKATDTWRDIPIIMVTSSDDMDDLTGAFEAGAMDYIMKPPGQVELLARVRSALRLKAETDQRKARERDLRDERDRSERLLLNILPQPIAERLKRENGVVTGVIADTFEETTVLFADIAGFTPFAAARSPEAVVDVLNRVFSAFDALAEQYDLEKIKTIGDAYMVVAGVPMPHPDGARAIAEMALAMVNIMPSLCEDELSPLSLRIGIHTGAVVAGVIGRKKFSYDLWGDTVNIASRMESHGSPNAIHVSEATYNRLCKTYEFVEREPIDVKGRGRMMTYWLVGKRS